MKFTQSFSTLLKLLLPVAALSLFLFTPLTSLAAPAHATAPAHAAAPGSAALIIPNIQQAPSCPNNTYTWVRYNAGTSWTCFGGDGYMGIGPNLFNVTEIDTGVNCGWFRIYDGNGGYYWPFDSYEQVLPQALFNDYPNKVTQMDIQGQNCTGHQP